MRTWLSPNKVLTVSAGVSSGSLVRLGNQDGDNVRLDSETVAANATVRKGPYTVATRWDVADTLDYTIEEGSGIPTDGQDFSYPVISDGAHAVPREVFAVFDDFLYQTISEADTPWILNSGSDAQAIDPAINAQAGGAIRLTSGDAGTGVAADGSQLVCHLPMKPNVGGLVFECRLKINTAITDAQVVAGLTDVTTLELPASVGSGDAITTTLSNGCIFVYDVGADKDEWFAVGVSGDTDATGNGATGIAPVADAYQTLRVEIDEDGSTARFYVNGTLVKTLTANAAAAGTDLFATVLVNATTTTSKVVDVDYIYVGHNR